MRIVVTAGPTREPIDPVRFISNRSSGRMGYAIAEAALEAGHEVTLISGPVALPPPSAARLVRIVTSDELYAAVHQHLRDCDVLVMCAAVSDYKPVTTATQKMEKHEGAFALQLNRRATFSLHSRAKIVRTSSSALPRRHMISRRTRIENCAQKIVTRLSRMMSAAVRSEWNLLTTRSRFMPRRHTKNNFARAKKNHRARNFENNFRLA